MDKSKAKKAVKKSSSRKKMAESAAAQAVLGMQAQAAGQVNPEIQAMSADLQPADGYINPYRELGSMAPTMYTAGNLLPGYNVPQMVPPRS